MNILITGAAGFIGSHVGQRLSREGHRIIAIDDFNDYYDPGIKWSNLQQRVPAATLIKGDIRDTQVIEEAFRHDIDAVIHLAARAGVRPSIHDPQLYISTNIQGTFNLLEATRRNGIKDFIFASSSSVYGMNEKAPFSEADPISGTISPYAMTKLAGEQMCSNFSHLYGIRCICLRFFTVYGPSQRPDLAIHKFTDLIQREMPVEMYGDGSSERDYTYIDDIVEGVVAALHYDKAKFDIFNLGESETTSLRDLINIIGTSLGKNPVIVQQPDQAGDVPRTYADITKARRELNYQPGMKIIEGIPKFIEWYINQKDVPL